MSPYIIFRSGVHHKKKDCNDSAALKKVQDLLAASSKYLYPKEIVVTTGSLKKKNKVPKANGGWGDLRDKRLCLNLALPVRNDSDVNAVLDLAKEGHDPRMA